MNITRKDIDKIFERNTISEIYPSKEDLYKHLLEGKPFHIYLGIDPTSDKIHLGHVQNILFLEDLRKVGAKITLLFGSFTGLVGDPTDKSSTRKQLTQREIKKNLRSWKKQVKPVLDLSLFSGARVDYNSRWFSIFSFLDCLNIARETTVQQLLERDMFKKRLEEGKPLHTHELLYPLLQGYDSVAMKVDGELCGTDQTFNALMGRTMVKRYLDKEKFVIAMNLIEGDGVLMSKSTGTGVFVDIEKDGNHRMFGSIMALPDSFIIPLFNGCTRVPMEEIKKLDVTGVNARDAKLYLAQEIVKQFWGKDSAQKAHDEYVKQFQKGEVPEHAEKHSVSRPIMLLDVVTKYTESSRSEAKRKITQGAVTLDGKKITDTSYEITDNEEHILRVGRYVCILS